MTIGAILKTNECKKTILKLKFSRRKSRKYCCVYRDTYLKVTHEYTEQLTEKKIEHFKISHVKCCVLSKMSHCTE